MSSDCSPLVCEHCKYKFPISYRRKILCTYYMSYIVDADYKSYLGISCDCLPQVSNWKILLFIICKLFKYPLQLSYRRKVNCAYYMPYVMTKHIFYKTDYYFHYIYNIIEYHMISLYTDPDFKSYLKVSCDCIHLEPYWRKAISLFTHIYHNVIYFSECLNIFQILMNLVNQAIPSKLTTHLCDFYIHV